MSDSVRPHRRQPTRLLRLWDSPGKNTGVGCHFLLQCRKVKSESEVTQSCPTLRDPIDYSLPGSSVHELFQARVLEWVASAFSPCKVQAPFKSLSFHYVPEGVNAHMGHFSVTLLYCRSPCGGVAPVNMTSLFFLSTSMWSLCCCCTEVVQSALSLLGETALYMYRFSVSMEK